MHLHEVVEPEHVLVLRSCRQSAEAVPGNCGQNDKKSLLHTRNDLLSNLGRAADLAKKVRANVIEIRSAVYAPPDVTGKRGLTGGFSVNFGNPMLMEGTGRVSRKRN